MELSKKIKDNRTLNHLTQKDLGDLLNVSDKTISSWENGRTYPDISLIIKLSELFNLSLDDFLKEDNTMIKKIDMDLKLKNIYKYFLIGLIIIVTGIAIFLNMYQYRNQWIDRFNPLMNMDIGYVTLPTEVTYNGRKEYNKTSKDVQIPDPYKNMIVLDSPFGDVTRLTFQGGQSPKNKNYAMVQHKGLYVKSIAFLSWEAIPLAYRENMRKEYIPSDDEFPSNHFKQFLTD